MPARTRSSLWQSELPIIRIVADFDITEERGPSIGGVPLHQPMPILRIDDDE